jgi:AmiR/NasT family two-component response regulator
VAEFAESDDLQMSLESMSTIAQAQGMLMGRFDVSPDEALNLLGLSAELDGLSVYEVANNLVATRTWDR